MVTYEVQVRPLHPEIKNKIISNKETATYTHQYNGKTDRTYLQLDALSDMLFYYQRTRTDAIPNGNGAVQYSDVHARLEGNFWEVFAETNSPTEAKIIAKKLTETLGVENVKLAKITPISSEITFSDNA